MTGAYEQISKFDVARDLASIRKLRWVQASGFAKLGTLYELLPGDNRPDREDVTLVRDAMQAMLSDFVSDLAAEEAKSPPELQQSLSVAATQMFRLDPATNDLPFVEDLIPEIAKTWKIFNRRSNDVSEMKPSTFRRRYLNKVTEELGRRLLNWSHKREESNKEAPGDVPLESEAPSFVAGTPPQSNSGGRIFRKRHAFGKAFFGVLGTVVVALLIVLYVANRSGANVPPSGSVIDATTGKIVASNESQLPQPSVPSGFLMDPLTPFVRNLKRPDQWYGQGMPVPQKDSASNSQFVKAESGDTIEVYSRLVNGSATDAVSRINLTVRLNPVFSNRRDIPASSFPGLTVAAPGVSTTKGTPGAAPPRKTFGGAFVVIFSDRTPHQLEYVRGSTELLETDGQLSNASYELTGGLHELAQLPDDITGPNGLTIANLGIQRGCWSCRFGIGRYVRFKVRVKS